MSHIRTWTEGDTAKSLDVYPVDRNGNPVDLTGVLDADTHLYARSPDTSVTKDQTGQVLTDAQQVKYLSFKPIGNWLTDAQWDATLGPDGKPRRAIVFEAEVSYKKGAETAYTARFSIRLQRALAAS